MVGVPLCTVFLVNAPDFQQGETEAAAYQQGNEPT